MKILFQGDSITDCGRSRENNANVGTGYPLLLKAHLGFEDPMAYEFYNRGISGNRIVDVYARIKKDIINLKPDVMSILIGVNDVWHELSESPNGVDAEKFYTIYKMLISEIKAALPDVKIMIMEPFVLRASATEKAWEFFDVEVKKRAVMARRIADAFGLPFIPLQAGFDALSKDVPANLWLGDGVHPTSKGHEYIKRQWLEAFKAL